MSSSRARVCAALGDTEDGGEAMLTAWKQFSVAVRRYAASMPVIWIKPAVPGAERSECIASLPVLTVANLGLFSAMVGQWRAGPSSPAIRASTRRLHQFVL